MIEAKVICDSISPQGHRLTTFKLVYPKFIHGEFMTHRVFSRNASSSRAIPVAKLIAQIENLETRAYPVKWGSEQKGMQSSEELDDIIASFQWGEDEFVTPRVAARRLWDMGAEQAVVVAKHMMGAGLHKSVVNRILEPYSHIRVVVTATEWDNFFGLRLHKDAQPEIRVLAEMMWREYGESRPRKFNLGEWHLPFMTNEDADATREYALKAVPITTFLKEGDPSFGQGPENRHLLSALIRVSVARCARVSYESFETGKRSTVEEDLKLYERLVGAQPLHASPAEHQATPDTMVLNMNVPLSVPTDYGYPTGSRPGDWLHPQDHGNLVGWRQYRKMLSGEAVAPLPEEFRA